MHLRGGRTYAPSEADTHPGSALADGPPELHIGNGDFVAPSDTPARTECSVTLGDRDSGTTADSVESEVTHLSNDVLRSLSNSVAASLTPAQSATAETGGEDLFPQGNAISVNNISLNNEVDNTSSDDSISHNSSSSRSRRNRISHIDSEGFAHIIGKNRNSIQTHSTTKGNLSNNKFYNLELDIPPGDTIHANEGYAQLMQEVLDSMSDSEAKARIIARAKLIDQQSIAYSSMTRTRTSRTSERIKSITQPSSKSSVVRTAMKSDKEATIRSWRDTISPTNNMEKYTAHPSQLIYERNNMEMPSIASLRNPDKSNMSSYHSCPGHPESVLTRMTDSRQTHHSSYLSKINEDEREPMKASAVPAFVLSDSNTKSRTNIKMPPPEKYDGSPDFDKFERFIFSANNYYKWADLTAEERIQHIQALLKGNAAHFYMQNVARNPSEWTMSRFGKELFNYCFPRNYIELIQQHFDNLKQGRKPLLDYIRIIEKMAERAPNVDDAQKRRKLFEGANGYLRIAWRQRGLSAILTSFKNLTETGLDIESSAIQTIFEGIRTRRPRKETLESLGDCPSIEVLTSDRKYGLINRSDTHQRDHQSKMASKSIDRTFRTQNNRFQSRSRDNYKGRNSAPQLSKTERDELRAIGACFQCKQKGHLSRDCPKFRTLRPSTHIHAAAAEIGNINDIAKELDSRQIETHLIELFNVEIPDTSTRSNKLPKRGEVKRLLLPELKAAVPFKTDFFGVKSYDPYDPRRFTIDKFDPTHLCLYDWHTGDDHLLDAEILAKSPVEIIKHIRKEKLLLMLNDDLITKEIALKALKNTMLECSMADLPPDETPPPLISVESSDNGKSDTKSEGTCNSSEESNNYDALGVLQETYDQIADHLGEIEYLGDCQVQTIYRPSERFTIVPIGPQLIMIADHILNMIHNIKYDEFFTTDFNLNEWIRDEIIIRDDEIPLTSIHFGNGLWDNTWAIEPEEEELLLCENEDEELDNPLQLNLRQRAIYDLATAAANRRVNEFEKFGTNIRQRYPPMTRELMVLRRRTQDDQQKSPSPCPASLPDLEQLELNIVSTSKGKGKEYNSPQNHPTTLERNAAKPKDFNRKIPKSIVVEILINGQPLRALIDSGSLADFISSKTVDLLSLNPIHLAKPLPCQLAASGSRTMITCGVDTEMRYQDIIEHRHFDVINLESYDVILGTPFLYEHKVLIGFNPVRVVIGSVPVIPMKGPDIVEISSLAATLMEEDLDKIRRQLRNETADLCKSAEETSLPPLRAINHKIPLKDENKTYQWRPSRCPEALKHLWQVKRDSYLKTGRWKFAAGQNACPMLIINKKPGPSGEARIRTVLDKRQVNDNTRKMVSPLPNMETILTNVLRHRYRSLIDGKDAYEQIRIEPADVSKSLFTTPDGSMVSLVMQQGDCNAPATYQSLMNHIFGSYIGIFMDVYLDDIIIYSDTVQDHIKHCRTVFEILRHEKLYLTTADKLQFFANKLKILGHVIDEYGIAMDPHKIESVLNWKTPTNKELLNGFIGSVGFLAGNCDGIRIPLGILSDVAGTSAPWRWTSIEDLALQKVKSIVHEHRENRRFAIDYSPNAPPVNVNPDACLTGAGSTVSQGEDLKTAKIIAFWSGKFNDAQRNYPVHERELLAIVETLKRFRHLLLGIRFRVFTDHKPLEYLLTQKNLSSRQQRWIDILNDFDFEIIYIPGEANIIADALSRMYSFDPPSIVRAPSEFVHDDGDTKLPSQLRGLTQPVLTGNIAEIGLDLLMAETSAPRYVTRSRTGNAQSRTLTSTRGVAVLPISEEARNALASSSRGRSNGRGGRGRSKRSVIPKEGRSTPAPPPPPDVPTTEVYMQDLPLDQSQADPTTVNSVSPPCTNTPALTCSAPTSYTTTESLPPSPPPQSVDWGNEIGLLDSPSGLWDEIRKSYSSDPMYGTAWFTHHNPRDYLKDDGLIFKISGDKHLLCIPEGKFDGKTLREFFLEYGHTLLAHLGANKTYLYLRSIVHWPKNAR